MDKVSVVVPIYNGEEYLRDCIDSILGQSYTDIEIICVNDGSTDSTKKILDEYPKKDNRIVYLEQENKGVVEARKLGVKNASGDYVMFVDADDYIYKDAIKIAVSKIGNNDVLTLGIDIENLYGTINHVNDALDEGVYADRRKLEFLYSNMLRYNGSDVEGILQFCFSKLIRRSVVDKIIDDLNPNIHYAEDRELVYRVLLAANSVCVSHDSIYFYRYRKTSVLHTPNVYVMSDLSLLYNGLRELFSCHECRDILLQQLEQTISSRMYLATKYMGFKSRNQLIRYIIPFLDELFGKKLILYGAGDVGWSYYRLTQKIHGIEWILWVDKMPRDPEVHSISEMLSVEYDLIVIAVRSKYIAGIIINELVNLGVDEKTIIWEEPIVLGE